MNRIDYLFLSFSDNDTIIKKIIIITTNDQLVETG